MKYFLIFLIFISYTASAQDCDALNSLISFHGVTFGKPIPKSISSKAQTHVGDSYSFEYIVGKDTAESYTKMFKFNSTTFTYLHIWVFNELPYRIVLSSSLSTTDCNDISVQKDPTFFTMTLDRIKDIFGTPTIVKDNNLSLIDAIEKIYSWDCNQIRLSTSFTYSKTNPEFCKTNIVIVDKKLEKLVELNKLKK